MVETEFSAFFSLLGPLGVSINAEFFAQFGPFTFGYDTLGITEFFDSGFSNPLTLFDGFFVGDLDEEEVDVPELQFNIGLWAAAELNLAAARGGVGGGLFADIDFDLHDPDRDGRVRLKELATNVINEFVHGSPVLSPLAIFDITGKLTAELFAFVEVDLLLFEINERWHITDPITLLDFESNFIRVPTLATEIGGGVLQLNMGKNSEQRVEGDLTDFGETFIVYQVDSTHVKVWSPLVDYNKNGIDDEQEAQEYEVTTAILAQGGEGDDTIDLSLVTANIKFELEGGVGGADNIFGETGNDEIHGVGGADWLFGDG
ncbi:MAG TPA: hypothetical protein VFR05_09030, partial [Terriglobia bacterium]|nr:hypothetical protein [Terriglobia bacterium]